MRSPDWRPPTWGPRGAYASAPVGRCVPIAAVRRQPPYAPPSTLCNGGATRPGRRYNCLAAANGEPMTLCVSDVFLAGYLPVDPSLVTRTEVVRPGMSGHNSLLVG